jgi:hypothetical protein
MQRRGVAILDGFATGDADRVALDLNFKVRLADTGHLGDDHDIVTLSENIERWIGAATARARTESPAGAERVERLLKLKQVVERIGE